MSAQVIGWIATGLFAASYFFKTPRALRYVQAAAALLWIAYGVSIGSWPVVASNVIVAVIAVGSSLAGSGALSRRSAAETAVQPQDC